MNNQKQATFTASKKKSLDLSNLNDDVDHPRYAVYNF